MLLGATTGVVGVDAADEATPNVGLVRADGIITPVMATYIGRGIDRSASRGHAAVLIELDTPGGLSSAMDDIVADILASPIPVIVYVAPDGARAGSAGVYITYAAHVAAMAPATNIGSATPVQLGGEESEGDTAMDRKVVNDAVAKIRALAELRGRNADWGERAVRDAENIVASEAARIGVVDFVASSREDALRQADGREVVVRGQVVEVRSAGATLHAHDMRFFEKLLQIITDPNIAFVLISLGTLALIFELANPGSIGPGAAGVVMMVTGFYALGTLDTNWAGLILIGLAFILFAIDVFVASGGILTIAGIAAFLIGALLLSNTRNDDVLQISRVVVFTMTAMMGLFFFFIAGSVWKGRNRPVVTGDNAIIGHVGVARTALNPSGMVYVQGELWQATSQGPPIEAGERVVVTAIDGIRLTVRPEPAGAGLTPGAGVASAR
ncbi:MAG TPA: nodulation protein NfeD [Thermomicrobiales bacterium]|nr:nodulation protein NfeD [Thermomicrobiales bacterium]